MSKIDRLSSLALLFLREILPAVRDAFEVKQLISNRDLLEGSDALHIQPPERLDSLTEDILKELGPKTVLRDSRDIMAILGEEFGRLSPTLWTDEEIHRSLSAAVNRLRQPIRQFRFRVPISAPSGISVGMELGTADVLQIRNSSTDAEPPVMELVGCIEAMHENRVIDRVERHIKTIAGAFIVCGIARHYYARISNVPVILIEGSLEQLHLDATVGALVAGLVFGIPEDLDDVKKERARKLGLTEALSPTLRRIAHVITSTDAGTAALRSAAILYVDAVATTDPGRSVVFALMALEAVLLERSVTDTIVARLKEAVAYRLGSSPVSRAQLRKEVGRLYDFRSSFVHTGEVQLTEDQRRHCLGLVGAVLKREIDDLSPSPMG